MTLDEAIIHAEEAAKRNEEYAKIHAHGDEFEQEDAFKCEKCAKEHRQLVEWLKELKQYKEYDMGKQALRGFLEGICAPANDCVSRISVQEEITKSIELKENPHQLWQRIQALPPVIPAEKMGHWTHDGSHWENRFICSACGYKLFDKQTNYCPNCGSYNGGGENGNE